MPDNNTFVLNDETVVNSHGFRVANSGISLNRLKSNPVILAQHSPTLQSVIGRWKNIRIEGTQLLAEPEFDMEDEDAKKIAGKVERGFVKGVSLGLLPMGSPAWKVNADGTVDLVSSEALEASIVAIPSNKNAVKLYAKEGVEMSMDEIKLSVENVANSLNTDMNKLTLSVACLLALGLESAENMTDVAKSVEALVAKNTANEKLVKELQAKLAKHESEKAVELVDSAINSKKLGADQREAFLKLAQNDFDAAKSLIEQLSARASLGATKTPNEGTTEVKTADDFLKLSVEEQLAFKKDHADTYSKLFV